MIALSFVMICGLGAGPATISSSECSITLDGPRIAEIRNLHTGETLHPEGAAWHLYDAQNKPIELTQTEVTQSDAGVTLTAKSEQGDTLAVSMRADGPDICLRLDATTVHPGLRAAGFAFEQATGTQSFIAPILSGIEITATTPVAHIDQMYPGNWQSQFALLQSEGGGFWVRSTDTTFGFKGIEFDQVRPHWSLRFKSENQAPFTELTALHSPEWRISAYQGDWRVPTRQYRNWMQDALELTPFDPASWEAGIRCVVVTYPEGMTEAGLDHLAQRLRPEQTLIYIPSWRTHGYDEMYPDYEAAPGVADKVHAAQQRGFRVILHTDMPGVTEAHPFFEKVKAHQLRDAVTLAPVGWWLEKKVPQSFPFINVASPIFREEFVRRMDGIRTAVGPDAIHLDVSSPTWNDGNGLIDGLSYPQGARRLHDALAEALPKVVWGGESLTESTLRHERFYQVWPGWTFNNIHTHPIATELYWPFCRGYGYLGMPDPTIGEAEYVHFLESYAKNGVLTTIPVANLDQELRGPSSTLDALFALARMHQDARTEPDMDATVENGNYLCWRGQNAAVRQRVEAGAHIIEVNGKPEFGYARGVRAVSGLYPCGPWPAWNNQGAFGLNPLRLYLLTPVKPRAQGLHLVEVQGWAPQLLHCLAYPGAVMLQFAPYAADPVLRLEAGFATATPFVRNVDTVHSIEDGAVCQFEPHRSGGLERTALYILPPWHKPTADWTTGLRSTVAIPAQAELRFWIGIDDNAEKTDGATFLVFRDGEKIYERHYAEKHWEEVRIPLGNAEAKSVTLELATHPGPKNDPSWDMALFGDPGIYAQDPGPAGATRVRYDAHNGAPAEIEGATLTAPDVLEIPAPGTQPVMLFAQSSPACALPCDLLAAGLLPYIEQSSGSQQVAVYGSGELHEIASRGVPRRALNGHPPAGGMTVFPWVGRLPKTVAALHLELGLADNAQTDGVAFSVRVNGATVWNWSTTEPGWHEDSVDLRPYAGKEVLIELVTDSGATNHCDWANWAQVRIE